MPEFCANRTPQPTAKHEIHYLHVDCPHLPEPANRHPLGNHITCHTALQEAAKHFDQVDGCAVCSPLCHKT